MIKFLLLGRKIHRYLVLIVTTIFLIMAGSGIIIKYPNYFSKVGFIDLGMVRYIHNQLSLWLTFTLLLMAISGLVMYFLSMKFHKPSSEQH